MADDQTKPPTPPTIDFDFIKSPDFRVYHVDGAWGGMSPSARYINMTLFTERFPIPRQVTYKIQEEHILTNQEDGRVTRPGIVRELLAELVFDLDTADVLIEWLKVHTENLRKAQDSAAKEK